MGLITKNGKVVEIHYSYGELLDEIIMPQEDVVTLGAYLGKIARRRIQGTRVDGEFSHVNIDIREREIVLTLHNP